MKKLLCILFATVLQVSGQRPILEVDVVATDAGDGFLGLSEVATDNLATNTVARVKGGTTPGDGGGGNYLWDGSAWSEFFDDDLALSSAGITDADLFALGYVKLTNGKIPASYIPGATSAQFLGDRTDYVFIPIVGQSLGSGNTASSPITTTNPDSDILTFAGGIKSVTGEFGSFIAAVEDGTADPSGSQSGETGMVLFLDQVLGFADDNSAVRGPQYLTQVAAVPSARLDMIMKGASSADYYEDYLEPVIEAAGTVATGLSKTVEMPMVVLRQGEGGTIPATKADWKSQLAEYRAQIEAEGLANLTRQLPLKVLSYQTGGFGGGGTNTYPAEAQFELHQEEEWFMIGAPVYPVYGAGLYSTADDIHLTSAGYAWQGAREGRIAAKFLYSATKPPTCTPETVTASGNVGSLDFDLETAPLVIDETIEAVTTAGVKVVDGTGDLTISKLRIARYVSGERNRLRFNLNRAVGSAGKIRIGLDYNYPTSQVAGYATNLRDSTAETVTIDGVSRSLANWSPMGILDLAEDTSTEFPGDNLYVLMDDVSCYSDLQGSSDITEFDTAPAFTGQGGCVVIDTDSELDTNIVPHGSIESAWCVVYLSDSYAVSTSATATLLNTRSGGLSSNGVTGNLGEQDLGGAGLQYRWVVSTHDGGSFQNTSINMKAGFTGWALMGYSIDSVAGKVKAFCSPLAAQSGTETEDTGGVDSYTPAVNLELGRGSYTQASSGTVDGTNMALAGYAQKYLSTADIAAIIAHAEDELNISL